MINLLPPQIKKGLIAEKRRKLALTAWVLSFVPLLCLALTFIPIRLHIATKVSAEKEILGKVQKQYQTPEFLSLRKSIVDDNRVIGQLESFYRKKPLLGLALKALAPSLLPQGLYFKNVALSQEKNNTAKVQVTGFAPSREDLSKLQAIVENNKTITSPSFSPDSWIHSQNITFKLTFEITDAN